PKPELPDINIDDAKIKKAVRLYLKGNGDEAEVLSMASNKNLRIMLERMNSIISLKYLPLDEAKAISETLVQHNLYHRSSKISESIDKT
ncbi:hypothetical protein BGZ70_002397, partial [Mortierella alpina]